MSIYAKTKYQRRRCRGCGSEELEDSSDSRWWLPGIIVVEFEQALEPGQIFPLTDSMSETDDNWLDIEGLKHAVGNLWVKPPKPTFAFDHGHTAPNYKRFLTFYLRPDVNVPDIAKRLSGLRGVKRAAGEPRLSPPKERIPMSEPVAHAPSETAVEAPLLGEPLAVSGGAPLGLSIPIGEENEEKFQSQWYLFRSKADQVLNNGVNGAGVVVADIDWGFHVTHQEFVNKIKFKYNAASNNDNVSSGTKKWHGTGTLGLIGAGDNNAGMLGFAAGADLWAIKGQHGGSINNESWGNAIATVRDRPSDDKRKVILVEASAGAFNVEASTVICESIKQAIASDCVVVVPAGNGGADAGEFQGVPIPVSGSILVGSTQYTEDPDEILPNSNFGSRIVVSAPGADNTDVTCCTCANNTYRDNFGGTSGAAAKVAGAMALVLQTYPDVTHEQIVRAFANMPRIPPVMGRQMGCFLDVPGLLTEVEAVLAEDDI